MALEQIQDLSSLDFLVLYLGLPQYSRQQTSGCKVKLVTTVCHLEGRVVLAMGGLCQQAHEAALRESSGSTQKRTSDLVCPDIMGILRSEGGSHKIRVTV